MDILHKRRNGIILFVYNLFIRLTKSRLYNIHLLAWMSFNKAIRKWRGRNAIDIKIHPTQRKPYYICEYVSLALYKSIVHIYITK